MGIRGQFARVNLSRVTLPMSADRNASVSAEGECAGCVGLEEFELQPGRRAIVRRRYAHRRIEAVVKQRRGVDCATAGGHVRVKGLHRRCILRGAEGDDGGVAIEVRCVCPGPCVRVAHRPSFDGGSERRPENFAGPSAAVSLHTSFFMAIGRVTHGPPASLQPAQLAGSARKSRKRP